MNEIFGELKKLQKRNAISLVCFLVCIILMLAVLKLFGGIGLIFAVFAGISLIFLIKTSKTYTAYYKANVVSGILSEVFDDVNFEPKYGISEALISSTGMMQTGNRFSSNDLITGKYKGVPFSQSDVCIEEVTTDSDGNSQTTTIFKGRWLTFEFNKSFQCDMQIISKRFFASKRKGGLFSKAETKLKKIELENEEFNKNFKVFAQNEHEAFYILTPQIMGAVLDLKNKIKAPVMLMFVNGQFHIAVNDNKDAFEPKIFGKLEPEAERQRVMGDIGVITEFVDFMTLDRDIYKN